MAPPNPHPLRLARLVIAVAALAVAPPASAATVLDRAVMLGNSEASMVIVNAVTSTSEQGKTLAITVRPGRSLPTAQAQSAAERLFEDYAMASAARRGITQVSIYVTPEAIDPRPREVRAHTSQFTDEGRGIWSLTSRWASSVPDTSAILHLSDGTRLKVERSEVVRERMDGVIMPTMRVEILLAGLNPMLESDQIYSVLKSAWSDIFHQQAKDKGIASVELIAHVDPHLARFEVRDATMLQLVAAQSGAFPPLPVFPEAELKAPSVDAPAGASGDPEARFGHLDFTGFDRILDAALRGPVPSGVESQPLAFLSR